MTSTLRSTSSRRSRSKRRQAVLRTRRLAFERCEARQLLATDLAWAAGLSGVAYDTAIDSAGDVYVGGNHFIAKYSPSGALIWGGTTGLTTYSIATDSHGGVFLSGYFQGTYVYGPDPGMSITSAGGYDVFVAKLAADGHLEWARSMGGTADDFAYSIDVDSSGNLAIAGSFLGTADFDPGPGTRLLATSGDQDQDSFVAKFTSTGDLTWAYGFQGIGAEFAEGLAFDPSGNVIVGARFYGTVDFDPGPGTANRTSVGGSDAIVFKLTPAGELVWANQISSTGSTDGVFGIVTDPEGNVYATGEFRGVADFDPGASVYSLSSYAGAADSFAWKLTADGQFEWATQFTSPQIGITELDYGFEIARDQVGNLYVTGFVGNQRTFLAEVDGTGSIVRVRVLNGVASGGSGLASDASGSIYVAGGTNGSIDCDPSSGVYSVSGQGFLAKYVPFSPNASVTGRAWNDLNANGIQDPGEPSLTDVPVQLVQSLNATFGDSDDIILASKATSADGTYRFDHLDWIYNYFVVSNAPAGFSSGGTAGILSIVPVDQGGDDQLDNDLNPATGRSAAIPLSSGQVATADLGFAGTVPAFGWAARTSGNSSEEGKFIARDAAGNIYVLGIVSGSAIDFDPGPAAMSSYYRGFNEVVLVKYSRSGAFQWMRELATTLADVPGGLAIDSTGNVYIAGYFPGALYYGISNPPSPIDNGNAPAVRVLKIDPNGSIIWNRSIFSPSGGSITARALAISDQNEILLTGEFNGTLSITGLPSLTATSTVKDVYVTKLNTSGDFLWAKQFDADNQIAINGIDTDPSGNIYTTGTFTGAVDFDFSAAVNSLTAASNSTFVAKLTSAGDYVWAAQIVGATARQLSVTNTAVLLTGDFSGTVDFDPSATGENNLTSANPTTFVTQLDLDGEFVWTQPIRLVAGNLNNASGVGIAADVWGNAYVIGNYIGTVDFDPSENDFDLTSTGKDDIFIWKLDGFGDFVTAASFGVITTDAGRGITVDAVGNIFYTGLASGVFDFDPTAGTFSPGVLGNSDLFVAAWYNPTPPPPGDFNGDGNTDGADFATWQDNFPKTTGATIVDGDADGDGDVDGADFIAWQVNLPVAVGSSGPGEGGVSENHAEGGSVEQTAGTESNSPAPEGPTPPAAGSAMPTTVVGVYTLGGRDQLLANEQMVVHPQQLTVVFSDELSTVGGAGGLHSVTNPANWSLLRNGELVAGEPTEVTFAFNQTAQRYEATVSLAAPLLAGNYTLLIDDQIENTMGVALDGDGDGNAAGVFAQAFVVDEVAPLDAAEHRINSYTADEQSQPDIAIAADGHYVIVWQSYGPNRADLDIYAQRFAADGTPLAAAFLVNSTVAGNQTAPAIAMKPNGEFVVTWVGPDSSSTGVFARRFSAAGTPLAGEVAVNTRTSQDQSNPDIAISDAGAFVIVWESYINSTSKYDVYAQRFSSAGAKLGSEFRVNTLTTEEQDDPTIGMNPAGDFVIAWSSHTQASVDYSTRVQRYNAAGVAQGSEFAALSQTPLSYWQYLPSIAMGANGSFVIAFYGRLSGKQLFSVYAQAYDPTGTLLGSERLISEATYNLGMMTSAAANANGDFVIVWAAGDPTGFGTNIYAQRLAADGSLDGRNFRVNTRRTWPHENPVAAVDSNGNFVVAWQTREDGGYDIYSRQYCVDVRSPQVSDSHLDISSHTIVVDFNEDVQAAGSQTDSHGLDDLGLWTLYRSGADITSQIGSIAYTSDAYTQTYRAVLTMAGPLDAGVYTIILKDDVRDLAGHRLDGDRDGAEGGAFIQQFEVFGFSPSGSETRVNTTTTLDQTLPAVGMDAAGNYVVVWQNYSLDGQPTDYDDIFGQRYKADGTKIGGEFIVNTYRSYDQYDPSIAMNANGDFVVTWTSEGQDEFLNGVYGQRYSADGQKVGGEFQISVSPTANQYASAVAIDAAGNFAVAWYSYNGQDGNGGGIFARRFNAAGVGLGGEFQVNQWTPQNQDHPAIGMDALGNFVIAWDSNDLNPSGSRLYARRYDAEGLPLGNEFRVNTTLGGEYPSVAMDPQGNFAIAWDGNRNWIWLQRYDALGNPVGTETQVNDTSTRQHYQPTAAYAANGDLVVAWINEPVAGVGYNIYARRYSSQTTVAGSQFLVNTFQDGGQQEQAVAIDGNGNFVIAWSSRFQDGDGFGIYAQRYAAVSPPRIPADFNGDGNTDGVDFSHWQTNLSKTTGATKWDGDADGDGDVDGADFIAWQVNVSPPADSSTTESSTAASNTTEQNSAPAPNAASEATPSTPVALDPAAKNSPANSAENSSASGSAASAQQAPSVAVDSRTAAAQPTAVSASLAPATLPVSAAPNQPVAFFAFSTNPAPAATNPLAKKSPPVAIASSASTRPATLRPSVVDHIFAQSPFDRGHAVGRTAKTSNNSPTGEFA